MCRKPYPEGIRKQTRLNHGWNKWELEKLEEFWRSFKQRMGILSWWKGNKDSASSGGGSGVKTTDSKAIVSMEKAAEEVPGMNGAVEVLRPGPNVDVTVFEFGSVAVSADKVTLAGYCPVSDDFEPCRWEILPAGGSDAPQFRVVF
ncbi:hypothetical protein L6452_26312 [Arctium lappa]|uniref:Uncharacterized protein n=1 Tax=Arctium lappa TaxID=4217 RepID=A0ACB9ACX7_ARCLA|nr:hypothetical protein L6452_26312 [Arctium lappa]